jgi:hypothetical protein
MKIIYFAFIESPEVEGFFDDNLKLIDFWHCNDASWRSEYFNPAFKKLGINIEHLTGDKLKKCQKQLKKESRYLPS